MTDEQIQPVERMLFHKYSAHLYPETNKEKIATQITLQISGAFGQNT